MGRQVEIAVRVATICASFNGENILTGKMLDAGAAKATLDYQNWVRVRLTPNAGENPDAQCSNAIMEWMREHASKGDWVDLQALKRGMNYSRLKLGARVFTYAIQNLANPFVRDIEVKEVKRAKGFPQMLVRLVL